MEISPQEAEFLASNIEEELSDYRKYMDQSQQATNPHLRQLWRMFAEDERRHAERQQAVLQLQTLRPTLPPTHVRPAPAAPLPRPGGFEWRGIPWPGPGVRGCCGQGG